MEGEMVLTILKKDWRDAIKARGHPSSNLTFEVFREAVCICMSIGMNLYAIALGDGLKEYKRSDIIWLV